MKFFRCGIVHKWCHCFWSCVFSFDQLLISGTKSWYFACHNLWKSHHHYSYSDCIALHVFFLILILFYKNFELKSVPQIYIIIFLLLFAYFHVYSTLINGIFPFYFISRKLTFLIIGFGVSWAVQGCPSGHLSFWIGIPFWSPMFYVKGCPSSYLCFMFRDYSLILWIWWEICWNSKNTVHFWKP